MNHLRRDFAFFNYLGRASRSRLIHGLVVIIWSVSNLIALVLFSLRASAPYHTAETNNIKIAEIAIAFFMAAPTRAEI
jgi:hypothetical protein